MLSKHTKLIDRARQLLLPCSTVMACALLLWGVQSHYAIGEWLFWRYLAYWLTIGVWTFGCLNIGFHLTRSLRLLSHPASEVLLTSTALGVLGFALLMFLLGLVGLYHSAVFFILPLGCVAAFPQRLIHYVRRFARHLRAAEARKQAPATLRRVFTASALLYGAYCILLLYICVLTPENTSYDARWYHLGIAEHYVAEGGIKPFVEGWYVGAYPHLASFLYAWAFLTPVGQLFDRVELCAHLEFALFLLTLPGIALLSARLLKRSRFPFAWLALFLYPGIFLYDSNLIVGADHVAAFWACPIYLTFLRTYRDGQVRHWVLLAALMTGALLTKYSAVCILGFPLLILSGRLLYWLVAARRFNAYRPTRPLLGPALAGLLGLTLTATHWLCNWLWYDNPVYPYASNLFKSRLYGPFARELLHSWVSTYEWAPHGTLAQRLNETFRAGFSFAFVPHDWPEFHRDVPVFGFLFTLGLLILPFVKGAKRVWPLVLASQMGVFLWYWGMHQDRYLQLLVPWMAACTAATIALVWRSGVLARAGLVALIALQIIWGSDTYAIPAHAMLGKPPVIAAVELMASGYKKRYSKRFRIFEPFRSIGLAVPDDARILLHEEHLRTGLRVPVVSDWVRQQGGIDYGSMGSPGGVFHWAKSIGLTHVVWADKSSSGLNSIAGDLLFLDFAQRYTSKIKHFGGFNLARIASGKDRQGPLRVTYLGCTKTYKSGLYDIAQLRIPGETNRKRSRYPKPQIPISDENTTQVLLEQSQYLAYDRSCNPRIPKKALRGWKRLANRGTMQLWSRSK